MFIVTKVFTFSAAHFLTQYHGKCEKLHGHNYRLEISVQGPVSENGMVVDFVLLKKLVEEKVIQLLDHTCLNDRFPNPTAELIIQWIWEQLTPLSQKLKKYQATPNFPSEIKQLLQKPQGATLEIPDKICLFRLKLWETDTSFVEYQKRK